MRFHNPKSTRLAAVLAALIAVSLASAAHAVDGVVEINHAKALAGGVTASDTAGYPVTIDVSGSYRVTSNLTVAGSGTVLIEIVGAISGVTIDLNGFELIGGSTAVLDPVVTSTNVTVRNGTVRDSSIAIWLGAASAIDRVRVIGTTFGGINVGDGSSVTNSTVQSSTGAGSAIIVGNESRAVGNISRDNTGIGLVCGGYTLVKDNVVENNTGAGINCTTFGQRIEGNIVSNNGGDGILTSSGGAIVSNNTVTQNGGIGIDADRSLVLGNYVDSNTGFGLFGTTGTGYEDNVFTANNGGGAQVNPFPVELGANICQGNTTCP